MKIPDFKYITCLIIIILITCFGTDVKGQDIATIKAAFIERFTRFVDWPENVFNNNDQTFKILVLGENTLGRTLESLLSTIKIKGRDVEVIYSDSINTINDCQLVYVSPSMQYELEKIIKNTRNCSILTIGDTKGYAKQGIMINLFEDGNNLRYEVNKNEVEKSNLSINSLLLNYAVIIESDG